MNQNGKMIDLEKVLSCSRFSSASHKAALREKLFGEADDGQDGESQGIQELSLDELEMAAGGKAVPQVSVPENPNDEAWLELMKRNW